MTFRDDDDDDDDEVVLELLNIIDFEMILIGVIVVVDECKKPPICAN